MTLLEEAVLVALRAHAGQSDRDGAPYIRHVLRVMEAVHDEARVVAVLHDVLEDAGPEHLEAICSRLHSDELEALELLTRRNGEEYSAYIERLIAGGNRLAYLVKQADLRDNLRPCVDCTPELRERYRWALEFVDTAVQDDVIESPELGEELAPDTAAAEVIAARPVPPGMVEVTIDPRLLYDALEAAIFFGFGPPDKNRRSRVSAIPEAELPRIPSGPRGGIIRFLGEDLIAYIEGREERRRGHA